ncbi:hypothetical protein BGW80DRAFT_1315704 [Lactifluus volemus]|nr:hypothetical protein BGW80DRAFT_1315704 [Lactifluus volemus]
MDITSLQWHTSSQPQHPCQPSIPPVAPTAYSPPVPPVTVTHGARKFQTRSIQSVGRRVEWNENIE